MKRIILLLVLLLQFSAQSQSYSSNLRRVSREIDKIMAITSDIIDGTMTYDKYRKVQPYFEEQSKAWRKSQRSLDRLDEAPEAALIAVVDENIGGLIGITQENLKYWFQEDPRSNYGHKFVDDAGIYLNAVLTAMDAYAEQYDVNTRTSDELERFQTQMELFL